MATRPGHLLGGSKHCDIGKKLLGPYNFVHLVIWFNVPCELMEIVHKGC